MPSNKFDFSLSRELEKERRRLLVEDAELADESFQIARCPENTSLRLAHLRKLEEHIESLTSYYERASLLSAES